NAYRHRRRNEACCSGSTGYLPAAFAQQAWQQTGIRKEKEKLFSNESWAIPYNGFVNVRLSGYALAFQNGLDTYASGLKVLGLFLTQSSHSLHLLFNYQRQYYRTSKLPAHFVFAKNLALPF